MSWIDEIDNYKLIPVTTGDGVTYELKMIFKGGNINPLTSSFSFPGHVGSKPMRNSCTSPIYDFRFLVYQDNWNAFKNSISSPENEWLIKHPLYGDIKGHPTQMNWDNTKLGDVIFDIQFQQSISDEFPVKKTDYAGATVKKNQEIQTDAINLFSMIDATLAEIEKFGDFVDNIEEAYEGIIDNEYINVFYDIRQTLNNVEFDAYRFLVQINELLNLPSRLTIARPTTVASKTQDVVMSVEDRIVLIEKQTQEILDIDENDSSVTVDGNRSKTLAIFKECSGACNITALTATVITPSESVKKTAGFDVTDTEEIIAVDDYKYKKDVINTISKVNDIYNDYIKSISEIDITSEGFSKFIPNISINDRVTKTILLAIQEIKEISGKAKEDNIYITKKDTCPELLALELYGSASDENVNKIIEDNDLFGKKGLKDSWRNMTIRRNVEIIFYD